MGHQHLPSASVIIPTLHSPHLGDVLQSLHAQTYPPLEILVVGQDRTGIAHADTTIRFLETPHPVSPAIARNLGIAYARGEVCCFLDADCIPSPTWLAYLLAHYDEEHPVIGGGIAVGGESYWQRCDNIAAMGPFLTTGVAGPRDYLITANMAIRRDLVRRLGGFDEHFRFAASEDSDMSFRLRHLGYSLLVEPRAMVVHRTSRSHTAAVWRHIWLYGYEWPVLQARHGMLWGRSYWQWLAERWWRVAWALIPLMTLRDVWYIYGTQPRLLRIAPTTLPAVFWVRMAWYQGQIDSHQWRRRFGSATAKN